jgi:hypothetical protein
MSNIMLCQSLFCLLSNKDLRCPQIVKVLDLDELSREWQFATVMEYDSNFAKLVLSYRLADV